MQEHHSCWHKLRLRLLERDKTTWSLVIHDFATNTLYSDPGSIKNTFVQKKSSKQGLQQIPLLCFFPIPHFASIASVRRMSTLCPALFNTPKILHIVIMTHRSSWSSWMVLKKITIGVPTVRPGRIKKSLLLNSQFQLLANTGNSGIWSFFTDFCNNGLSGSIFCVTRDKQGILQKEKNKCWLLFCLKTLKVVELKFESVFKLH